MCPGLLPQVFYGLLACFQFFIKVLQNYDCASVSKQGSETFVTEPQMALVAAWKVWRANDLSAKIKEKYCRLHVSSCKMSFIGRNQGRPQTGGL